MLADVLTKLAEDMRRVAAQMETGAKSPDDPVAIHAQEILGAAAVAAEWAVELYIGGGRFINENEQETDHVTQDAPAGGGDV